MSRPRTFDKTETARRAMDLFWNRGFGATPAATISSHLGLGMGSIYKAYGSKDGLYRAALEQYHQRGLSFLAEALVMGSTVRDALKIHMTGRITEALEDPQQRGCLLVNTIGERLPRDSTAADFAAGMQQATRETITEALRVGIERGELRADTDTGALAGYLVTVMNGLMVTVKVTPDRDDLIGTIDLALGVVDAHRA